MGQNLAQTVHDLKQAYHREHSTGLRIRDGRRPPTSPHKLPPVRDIGIAFAKPNLDLVYTRDIDKDEVLVASGGCRT
jgi:hypothetical protein